MREAHQSLGRWDLALTPWGKAAEFHEICQIWNNHVTPLMKLSQMGLTTQTVYVPEPSAITKTLEATCSFRVKILATCIIHGTDGTGSTTLSGSLGATDLIQTAFGRFRGRGHRFLFSFEPNKMMLVVCQRT